MRNLRKPMIGLLATLVAGAGVSAESLPITVASTTSTEASGLFEHLLPLFTADTGIPVRVVAVGTGQAIRIAANGDADVLFVHHEPSERRFVRQGLGIERHPVMHNDFVLVGPAGDPAGIRGMDDAAAALRRIAAGEHAFISRGDDSGTHKREMTLWNEASADPRPASGTWYREAGMGMGATLNVASAMGGYTLSDRGTWIAFGNKRDLEILVEGDPGLHNPYGVIVVNPERFPHVHAAEAQAFADWLTSERGQRAIAAYRVDGQQLFFPEAAGR
ncbi:substrate-binding domain-containing protein [Lentisalinibacter sediminis]|uniref:substrate-binding domain-containing protein n=1 Tax=Lentisalinibacter sediminis TaxID=2992237 RepID=UPI00386E5812